MATKTKPNTADIEKFSARIIKNYNLLEGYYETPPEEHILSMGEMINIMYEIKISELENFLSFIEDYETDLFVSMVKDLLKRRTTNVV